MNRAPGSLFTQDADGWVRNTYLLKITSNDATPDVLAYEVSLEGLEGAEVLSDPVFLGPTETRTVPLIVRLRTDPALLRTIPFDVRITSPAGDLVLPTTFKTGASDVGATSGRP